MRKLFLYFLHGYQLLLGSLIGKCCRFYPSCSDYALAVVVKYGIWRGLWLTSKRLLKCHPWHPGGIDFP